MRNDQTCVSLTFPLHGEWTCPNTPGIKIPSHGTNAFGSRYAIDFLQVDWHRWGHPCYRGSCFRYLLSGVAVEDCYCYGKTIYAPCDGTVIEVRTDCVQRKRAVLWKDLLRSFRNRNFDPMHQDITEVAGNYIILQCEPDVYIAFCHLQPDSILVKPGQYVHTGEAIARIGHTGNSMFPHLHFQVMNSSDWRYAKGVPCTFQAYARETNGEWEDCYETIPRAMERIRYEP